MAACALVAAALVACSKEDAPAPQDEPEFYTVQLGWGGEIVDIAYEPLDTRAATNDVYGIQVYSTPDIELEEGEVVDWIPFAYGLFDDPNNISVNLLKGYKYKFVATMVKDGKTKLNYNATSGFSNPFNVRQSTSKLENIFNYSPTPFTSLSRGGSYLKIKTETGYSSKSYSIPNTDRYYGEFEGYTPGASGEKVNIKMKRASFGVKFIVKGKLANSGTLHINMVGAPAMKLALTNSDNQISEIFTFDNVYAAWDKNKYTENIDMTISWTRSDGSTVPLGSTFSITCKRNATTVVHINIENDGQGGKLGLEIDETGDPVADGENDITITDGEVVDTEVDTNK